MKAKPILLVHGSWHTGFVWHKTQAALRQRGLKAVHSPNLSGMEARNKPASINYGLQTHIDDITRFIDHHQLDQVVLVGHSYSGFVISGVAEVMPGKISALIFLDAFIPQNDQCLFDLMPPPSVDHLRSVLVDDHLRSKAEGAEKVWLIPPSEPQAYGVKKIQDIETLKPHMVYTPVATFEEKIKLENAKALDLPRFFIRCTEFDFLAPYEEKAIRLGWQTYQIASGHDAMVNEPEKLADILVNIVNPG